MSAGIVGFGVKWLAIFRDRPVPRFVASQLRRVSAIALGCLRKTATCNQEQKKQPNLHGYSLARGHINLRQSKKCKKRERARLASSVSSDHQTNLMLSCPMRGSRAFVTIPKLPSISPLGFKNCA